MPVKTALRGSLLNVQPVDPNPPEPVGVPGTPSYPLRDSGFDRMPLGYSDFIERQFGTLRDSPDAVSLVGVQDSTTAQTVSADPQRPELIMLTRPFFGKASVIRDSLRLRSFEASLDEADYQQFVGSILSAQPISNRVLERFKSAQSERSSLRDLLAGMSDIATSIDNFRDNADFLLNSKNIHQASTKYFDAFPRRFCSGRLNPSLLRTFSGYEDSERLSNSALLSLLIYTLLLPGNIEFSRVKTGSDRNKRRFYIPRVRGDQVGKLLSSLTTINVVDRVGFRKAQSLLPSDPVKRLAVLAEALSYELTVSVGLKRIGETSMRSIITDRVGITDSPIFRPPTAGTVTSYAVLGDSESLPLETRDAVVEGNLYPGVLTSLIDPAVRNGTLDFSDLARYSKNLTRSWSAYIEDVKKLRMLDDPREELSPTSIVKIAIDRIMKGLSTLEPELQTQSTIDPLQATSAALGAQLAQSLGVKLVKSADGIDKAQVSQVAYLNFLAKSDYTVESMDRRHEAYLKIFGREIPEEDKTITRADIMATLTGGSAVSDGSTIDIDAGLEISANLVSTVFGGSGGSGGSGGEDIVITIPRPGESQVVSQTSTVTIQTGLSAPPLVPKEDTLSKSEILSTLTGGSGSTVNFYTRGPTNPPIVPDGDKELADLIGAISVEGATGNFDIDVSAALPTVRGAQVKKDDENLNTVSTFAAKCSDPEVR